MMSLVDAEYDSEDDSESVAESEEGSADSGDSEGSDGLAECGASEAEAILDAEAALAAGATFALDELPAPSSSSLGAAEAARMPAAELVSSSDGDSSDSEDVLEPAAKSARACPAEPGQVDAMRDDEDDEEESVRGGAAQSAEAGEKTRHEQPAPEAPASLPVGEQLERAAAVVSLLDDMAVLKALPGLPPLAEASLLCLPPSSGAEAVQVLGRVAEIFGPVSAPLYSVRVGDTDRLRLSVGDEVFVAPAHSSFLAPSAIKQGKGTDASGADDDECQLDEQDFSDDEAEAEYRRKRKLAQSAAAGSAAGASAPAGGGRGGGKGRAAGGKGGGKGGRDGKGGRRGRAVAAQPAPPRLTAGGPPPGCPPAWAGPQPPPGPPPSAQHLRHVPPRLPLLAPPPPATAYAPMGGAVPHGPPPPAAPFYNSPHPPPSYHPFGGYPLPLPPRLAWPPPPRYAPPPPR